MKIWLVWFGCYEERGVDGVFATQALADTHAEVLRRNSMFSVWDRDSVEVESREVVGA